MLLKRDFSWPESSKRLLDTSLERKGPFLQDGMVVWSLNFFGLLSDFHCRGLVLRPEWSVRLSVVAKKSRCSALKSFIQMPLPSPLKSATSSTYHRPPLLNSVSSNNQSFNYVLWGRWYKPGTGEISLAMRAHLPACCGKKKIQVNRFEHDLAKYPESEHDSDKATPAFCIEPLC